ncbi:LptM family lipoprotein [Pikeienuella piscinae]|nr:hypothetical protein [Pikeienuella piscinae]
MNPRLRNVLIVLAFIVLCASLVGCGRKGEPQTPAPAETAEPAE